MNCVGDEAPDLTRMEPLLLPRPRSLELTGGFVTEPSEAIECAESSSGDESYRIDIAGDGHVRIAAATHQGLQRARATMRQLRTQFGDRLPCLAIDDAPVISSRGVMFDASRCRVPTRDTMMAHVQLLADLKLNHLEYYTEHTFQYAGHEDIWRKASPMTAADIRAVDAAALAAGCVLGANQNCFGHMERWLRHEAYAGLAETLDEFDFYGVKRRGPFSLCPVDPRALELVRDLLRQLLPNFTSGLVNIGCDETADVGWGRSAEAVRRAPGGTTDVFMDFVAQVAAEAREAGFTPMFWADVILRHPERVRDLPEDLVSLAWGYEPDSPFDTWCSRLAEAGRRFRVCPGTSSWRSITGRTSERRGNLAAATEAAMRFGAEGLMVTDWGDLGHRQQDVVALPGIAAAAAASWTGTSELDPRTVSLHVFGDRTLRLASWLDELGDADESLRAIGGVPGVGGAASRLRNATALFEDMHPSGAATALPRDADSWWPVVDRLEGLSGRLPDGAHAQWIEQARLSVETALFAARRGAVRREGRASMRRLAPRLAEELESLIERRRSLWLESFRPGGLDESSEPEGVLLQECRSGSIPLVV